MRRLCIECRKREAKFIAPNGRVKRDRDHELCFQCFRALVNRTRETKRAWARAAA